MSAISAAFSCAVCCALGTCEEMPVAALAARAQHEFGAVS
jgi:hypothetical protein